jgi:predicted glycogen debranching enzyme
MWYSGYYLPVEAYRGLDDRDDHLLIGTFRATLAPGESLTLALSAGAAPALDGGAALATRRARDAEMLSAAGVVELPDHGMLEPEQQLLLAADQFIVVRTMPDLPDGRTVIAGYPWFTDWGRDTMIALPGLTLATGRPEVAQRILRTFARFVDQGMLPNRFPDAGDKPEYNTVDATLWYFEAIRAYVEQTGDAALLAEIYPTMQEIVEWHVRGTRYNIRVDPADGLLYAGDKGVQLTWMDAKVGDWVVTPRRGKAVEVNALWYNALENMAAFARQLDQPDGLYVELAAKARQGFARFWNNAERGCYDVIDGPDGVDVSLRPNQLLAVSLPYSPLDPAQQKAVVDVCALHLLTSHGLRSLAPDEPAYIGHYGGDAPTRDGAYHQGTVWAWLIGPFVAAHLRVYRNQAQARSLLMPLLCHVSSHGVGSISEIFDGDPPFTPRGCFAQAWSVAEVLRALRLTASSPPP